MTYGRSSPHERWDEVWAVEQVRPDSRHFERQDKLLQPMVGRGEDGGAAQVGGPGQAVALLDALEKGEAVARGEAGDLAGEVEGVVGDATGRVVGQAGVDRDVH